MLQLPLSNPFTKEEKKSNSPLGVRSLPVLEDDTRGDFLTHPVPRYLIEPQAILMAPPLVM
jgi:hypothetical protein